VLWQERPNITPWNCLINTQKLWKVGESAKRQKGYRVRVWCVKNGEAERKENKGDKGLFYITVANTRSRPPA
jgi:hypothetical protein